MRRSLFSWLSGFWLMFAGSGLNGLHAQAQGSGSPVGNIDDAINRIRNRDSIDLLSYVNPFIGTAKSNVFTRWGNEGGTFPGAAAPWGYMQLTPETRMGGGYDYGDPSICFFSCFHHMSGYPGGSAGLIQVMPVEGGMRGTSANAGSQGNDFLSAGYSRKFLHQDEIAEPGYYRVLFRDNNTLVETTVTERTGIFRFSFAPGVTPRIFIKTRGKISRRSSGSSREWQGSGLPVIFRFSETSSREEITEGGLMLSFPSSSTHDRVILLRTSISMVGPESAVKNIDAESGNLDFDFLRKRVQQTWLKELSVVRIGEDLADHKDDHKNDRYEEKKKIFYTALYHSMLLPWVISDVEGNYLGKDSVIHKTSGKKEYGGFSPWDTFRSLHPLLCLLFPERQQDMVLSMLDISRQTGYLPTDPMTGNHSVPIILDSYAKGIRGFDPQWAYSLMKKGLLHAPFPEKDRKIYGEQGFIPYTYPESVTRTVEYAFDDWAISEFAKLIHSKDKDGKLAERQSFNYRNLLDPVTLFLLPRRVEPLQAGDQPFIRRPGNAGYKEGDKWVYTYFVPQHPNDLVNLMGGVPEFTARLDSALANKDILFDNETVFHIPYFFNYSGRPDRAQWWVREIMNKRFSASPGGLPGNDDLGSVSSWYVFSAMGFFPFCPGRPVYTIGSPLFHSLTLSPEGRKEFTIKTMDGNSADQGKSYVRSLLVNNKPYSGPEIPHSLFLEGGELIFVMGGDMNTIARTDEPDFYMTDCSVARNQVAPNELFWLRFNLVNKGGPGTKILRLKTNGKEISHKNCLLLSGTTVKDSLPCRLYAFGRTKLEMEGMNSIDMEVMDNKFDSGMNSDMDLVMDSEMEKVPLEITGLAIRSLLKEGENQSLSFSAQNTGGITRQFFIPVTLNDIVIQTDTIVLEPGERKAISQELPVSRSGWQMIRVGWGAKVKFKVYKGNMESLLLDLSKDSLKDLSGFGNHGKIIADTVIKKNGLLSYGKELYAEIPSSPSLDDLGETLTMMISVYPTAASRGLVDLFSKGDHHVLQITGNKYLSFFAGGWGRGDCTVKLPANWLNHWHQLAGVCTGDSLRVYIDGELKGSSAVDGKINLSAPATWTLGRNEEFPGERIFQGYLDDVKLFAAPLTEQEIRVLSGKEK
ncbi:GH92 family glycosyl hydrolase [Flavitalea flava]